MGTGELIGATDTFLGAWAFVDVSEMVVDSPVSPPHAAKSSNVPSKTSNRDVTNLTGIMTLETASVLMFLEM